MKSRSYNKEIQNITAQMIDVFNNIQIDRRDAADNIQKTFYVPCVYGSRSRMLKSLENRNAVLKPPLTCLSIAGINRDVSRVHSVNEEIFSKSDGTTFDIKAKIGVPITIDYNLGIITKFLEDMDQLISNFTPFFNPDIYIVYPHPGGIGNIKAQVIWNGNLSITYPEEIAENEWAKVVAETSFTVKGWLFPGMGGEEDRGKLIKYINLADKPVLDEDDNIDAATYLNKWYSITSYSTDTSSFLNYVTSGIITDYDFLRISGWLSGYWQDVSGEISGTIYNPLVSADLVYLINNYNDPDLTIFTAPFKDPGFLASPMATLDFLDVWSRMVSGDLSGIFNVS